MFASARTWARSLKRDIMAVYFAARNPATPMWLRWFAIAIAAYALSPIDLIPDFIPILGYLDDLLIVPLGIIIIVRFLPPQVLAAARLQAESVLARPASKAAAAAIIAIWIACALALGYWLLA